MVEDEAVFSTAKNYLSLECRGDAEQLTQQRESLKNRREFCASDVTSLQHVCVSIEHTFNSIFTDTNNLQLELRLGVLECGYSYVTICRLSQFFVGGVRKLIMSLPTGA